MNLPDLEPFWLTLELAAIVTILLMVLATPLAWWLANSRARVAPIIEAITALPLVLPPTVLGFYLLLMFSPQAIPGGLWLRLSGQTLSFSFSGLVIASVIYSLPFAVQPLQTAFSNLGRAPLEAAASLNARPLDAFLSVVLPLSRRGYLTASVLTFAHTMGEFGVVLMVGGNIPGQTRLISIAVYEQVERGNYSHAHVLSAILLVFSFLILLTLYATNSRARSLARS